MFIQYMENSKHGHNGVPAQHSAEKENKHEGDSAIRRHHAAEEILVIRKLKQSMKEFVLECVPVSIFNLLAVHV